MHAWEAIQSAVDYTFSYFAGGLAKSSPNNLCNDLVQQELQKGEYIVCSVEAESFEELVSVSLYQANQYLFNTWLPHHNIKTQPFSAEKYYPISENTYLMEIWVMPLSET